MQLLSKEDVTSKVKTSEIEGQERIRKMRAEENQLSIELSNLRGEYEAKTSKIKKEFEAYAAESAVKIAELTQEVGGLEARRIEALRPIEEIAAKADRHMNAAREFEKNNEKKTAELDVYEEGLKEKDRLLEALRKDIETREESLLQWLMEKKSSQKQHDEILNELDTSQKHFEEYEMEKRAKINRLERELLGKMKKVETIMEEIKIERSRMAKDRRAIKDGYTELAKARKEILGRSE